MKVEKHIPIPMKYPFDQMELGDSFLIPQTVKRQTVSIAALRYGNKHGMKFTTRKMSDGSYRCWRIK